MLVRHKEIKPKSISNVEGELYIPRSYDSVTLHQAEDRTQCKYNFYYYHFT